MQFFSDYWYKVSRLFCCFFCCCCWYTKPKHSTSCSLPLSFSPSLFLSLSFSPAFLSFFASDPSHPYSASAFLSPSILSFFLFLPSFSFFPLSRFNCNVFLSPEILLGLDFVHSNQLGCEEYNQSVEEIKRKDK